MAIVRTYECGDCGVRFDKLHFDRNEPAPECPGCEARASSPVPAGFSIGNSKMSQAADITQDIMEKDLGFTDMRDRLREGDIAAPRLPPNLQKAADNMWNAPQGIIQSARAGAAAAAKDKRNPISMIQGKRRKEGPGPAVACSPVNHQR